MTANGQQLAPESAALLSDARAAALRYADSLPNFLCIEHVDRAADWNNTGAFTAVDTLDIQVGYVNGKERYQTLAHGKHSSSQSMETIAGAISEGEFGSALRWIFDPAANATFTAVGPERVGRFETTSFDYGIDQAHSRLEMRALGHRVMAAFHGRVYIDEASRSPVRLIIEGEPPADFRIRDPYVRIDYDWQRIGEQRYLVPVNAETQMTEPPQRPRKASSLWQSDRAIPAGSYESGDLRYFPGPPKPPPDTRYRNRIDFHSYRKFAAGSKITFDPPSDPEKKL
jgi:hypothetical protein